MKNNRPTPSSTAASQNRFPLFRRSTPQIQIHCFQLCFECYHSRHSLSICFSSSFSQSYDSRILYTNVRQKSIPFRQIYRSCLWPKNKKHQCFYYSIIFPKRLRLRREKSPAAKEIHLKTCFYL